MNGRKRLEGDRAWRIILASGSPRRRELLREAGYEFDVVPPNEDVECGVCSQEGPAGLVTDLAFRKAADVVRRLSEEDGYAGRIVVAADTVAECDGMVLGKPASESDARRMLERLSGRDHRVLTGVCVWKLGRKEPNVQLAVTRLAMDRLTAAEIDDYIASGLWEGKAGAFGYQDRLGWIHLVEGSESNVVGLPMELLSEMLEHA